MDDAARYDAPSMNAPSPVTGLRRHPYRILFPLGWLMAWVGLAPWLLFAWGANMPYPRDLHVMTMIQGVLTTFAVGFLFTMLPRRLDSPAPTSWQMALAVLVPPLHAILTWNHQIAAAHAVWAVLAGVMLLFTASRIYGSNANRRGPIAFAWVPLAWAFGLAGAILLAIATAQKPGEVGLIVLSTESIQMAWLFLTQAMFLCLVIGVGGLFLPLVCHKTSSVDADQVPNAKRQQRWHMLAALLILFSFALQAMHWTSYGLSLRTVAIALRAAVAAAVLCAAGGILKPPSIEGTQRKLIWAAAWCIPLGLALTAAIPSRPQIGLHVFFISGVGLITLGVALHVGLSHSTGQDLVFKPVWQVQLFGALIAVALGLRIVAEIDLVHRFDWLGAAAVAMLLALLPWGQLVLTRLVPLIGKP